MISVLTEELVRRGHEVTLCASGDSRTSATLVAVQKTALRPAGLSGQALQYSLLHTAEALAIAGSFDIVHNHSGPPSELGMALSALCPVPMLTTLHNPPREDTSFIWENYRGWYNTISNRQARSLPPMPLARYGGTVYNGIDVDSFPFQEHKEDYALFLGRFIQDKGPHLAIEAARMAGLPIILAGKIGSDDERSYFDARIAWRLDEDGVTYVGEADAMTKRRLLAGARVLLMPLLWDEPFGLVMTEAMACGTPVIAFRRGAAPEIVDDGVTGFLVEDLDEMALAISCLSSIDAAACRRRVEEHFGPSALADRYLSLYQRITSGLSEVTYDRLLA